MAYNKAEYIKNKNDEMASIKNKIKELAINYSEDPRIFSEVLQFNAKFYRYSSRNNQLIYTQNPFATFTASFKKFKEMGYNVKKGEHGMKIICPNFVKYLEDPDTKVLVKLSEASKELKEKYKNKEVKIKTAQSYKLGTVFDISQTNCPPEDYPKYFNVGYKDEPAEKLYNAIKKYAKTKLNCPVNETDMKSISLRGLYNPGTNEIKINKLLQDTQRLSTLTHELGHAIMHKDFSEKSTAQKELEADALSIMLSAHFGVELTEQRIRHLSDCFNAYKERLSEQQSENASREDNLDDIDKVLENVLEKFKEIIPAATETVFKELGRELPEDEKEKSFVEQVDEVPDGNMEVAGLYRRDNGEEFIHYAVTNERGERRELLTNGMYAWSDNDKNAERMCSLTSVGRIDTEKMENLLNKYQPDKSALQALEIVKGAQQSQAQIRKPQML